jgi:hypothetical protein
MWAGHPASRRGRLQPSYRSTSSQQVPPGGQGRTHGQGQGSTQMQA